jgi:Ala-tRNA(Pro) deacylase
MKIETFLEEQHCQFERVAHSPTYSAQRLAQELHVSGQEVAKTVLLRSSRGCKFVVAVLPASKSIDLAAASKLVGRGKLQLATELEIGEHCPDCEFGVLPPFGSRYGMRTIVDSSLVQDEEIVFAANTHHEAIRMKFEEFRELEDPQIGQFALLTP